VRDDKIAAVETATVTLRANPALVVRGARNTQAESSFVLVRVTTRAGVVGYGEISATPYWSGEDATSATHFVANVLGPALVGRPLVPIAGLVVRMDHALGGNWFTKAGIETACWDALGRTLDMPVTALLGGPLRDQVPVKISLSGDGDVLRGSYEAAVAAGFRAFKVKVGREPRTDAARVALARELAGDDAFLGADANGGWDRSEAREAIRLLAPSRPAFIEQPVAAGDVEGLRALRPLGIPVVADESVDSHADLVRLLRAEAADAVNLYVGKSGGLERALQAARIAAAFGLGVLVGSNGEMGVGAAAQVHLACACPALGAIPCDIIGHHYYEEDVLERPVPIDGVRASLPEGPGLGVEPGEDVRRQFA
jgi:L-alanine-DL-glutamate epimerase-like enolase superfamily enzyme